MSAEKIIKEAPNIDLVEENDTFEEFPLKEGKIQVRSESKRAHVQKFANGKKKSTFFVLT